MSLPANSLLFSRQFFNANEEPVPYHGELVTWRVSAYVFVIKDGKILIAKNREEKIYDILGGGVELGETIEEALQREALEEGGARIQVGKLVHTNLAWFYHRKDAYYQALQLFYEAEILGDAQSPSDPDIEWSAFVPLSEIGTKYRLPVAVEAIFKKLFV